MMFKIWLSGNNLITMSNGLVFAEMYLDKINVTIFFYLYNFFLYTYLCSFLIEIINLEVLGLMEKF